MGFTTGSAEGYDDEADLERFYFGAPQPGRFGLILFRVRALKR